MAFVLYLLLVDVDVKFDIKLIVEFPTGDTVVVLRCLRRCGKPKFLPNDGLLSFPFPGLFPGGTNIIVALA